jgi:hypothetical protein
LCETHFLCVFCGGCLRRPKLGKSAPGGLKKAARKLLEKIKTGKLHSAWREAVSTGREKPVENNLRIVNADAPAQSGNNTFSHGIITVLRAFITLLRVVFRF